MPSDITVRPWLALCMLVYFKSNKSTTEACVEKVRYQALDTGYGHEAANIDLGVTSDCRIRTVGMTRATKHPCRLLWHHATPTYRPDDLFFENSAGRDQRGEMIVLIQHKWQIATRRRGIARSTPPYPTRMTRVERATIFRIQYHHLSL